MPDHVMSRRNFLGTAAGAAIGALGASALLDGCGSSTSTTKGDPGSTTPKRGGVLRVGLMGGSPSDTLNPLALVTVPDTARAVQLFDSLVEYNQDAQLQLALAEELTPNSNATEWTIRVRSGVTFHDGKTLTAADVAYSLQQVFSKKVPSPTAGLMSRVEVTGIRQLDDRTVRVPCSQPFASFPQTLVPLTFSVIPQGFDVKRPVGTGPYKFGSWQPGVESHFSRNDNYWRPGLPYSDSVTINEYADETSMTNALLAGQEDVIAGITSASALSITSGGKTVVYSDKTGAISPFTMRVDVPPFNDVRVRQAMRLVADRQEMLNVIFDGHGAVANDVFSPWDPAYDHALPQRQQDVAQAKSLLRAAGREDLRVTLLTAPIGPGTVSAATVLAQQAKAAGITINLQSVQTGTLFGPNYLHWPFSQDLYYYFPYLTQVENSFLPTSPYNETHWNRASYSRLYNEAQAAAEQSARTPIEQTMMEIDHNQGGYLIPYFIPTIDAHGQRLKGVVPTRSGISRQLQPQVTVVRLTPPHKMEQFIGGRFELSASGETYASVNPTLATTFYEAPRSTAHEVNRAVKAARAAFEAGPWRRATATERGRVLRRLARLLDDHADELAVFEATDVGKPIRETQPQMSSIAEYLDYAAGLSDKVQGHTQATQALSRFAYTRREPIGVVGAILPWNSPLLLAMWKLAPALAAGNTIVLKPSEHGAGSLLRAAELFDDAGVPPGVINVVTGLGDVGAAVAAHPDVDMVTFTGGTGTGRRVAQVVTSRLRNVTLELGGKSAQIVFEDADTARATASIVAGIYSSAGQSCIAGSRALIHERLYDTVVQSVCGKADVLLVGDPLDGRTDMGPLCFEAHRQHVEALVEKGVDEGAEVLTGGGRPDVGLPGWFYEPTVLAVKSQHLAVAQEEVFGPVLTVQAFHDEDDAVRLANESAFGLVAGVWTRDPARAHRVAAKLEVGTVWVNTYRANTPTVPTGGFRDSGLGKENGLLGIDPYLRTKAVVVEVDDAN